jgi:hypothetical protein
MMPIRHFNFDHVDCFTIQGLPNKYGMETADGRDRPHGKRPELKYMSKSIDLIKGFQGFRELYYVVCQ